MLSTEICLKMLDLAVEDGDYATQKAFNLTKPVHLLRSVFRSFVHILNSHYPLPGNLCLSHGLLDHMEARLYRKIWLEDTVTANLLVDALRIDLYRRHYVQKIDLAVGSLWGGELAPDRQPKEAAFREVVRYCQPKEFRMVVRYDSFKSASILREVCHERLESLTIHALAEGREDRYDEWPFIAASSELINKALNQLKCLIVGGLAIVGFTCVN